jgi:hypothetical protein
MLALTHHFIVQVAAWHAGYPKEKLFRDYAVLGDDVVIFSSQVAKKYHRIITSLGVECNLGKSILSHKGIGLEFAKKTFYRGNNISPTPLRELHAALKSPVDLWEYGKKYSLSLPQLLKVAGFGYKVLGSLKKPLRKLNLKVRYLSIVAAIRDPALLQKAFMDFLPNFIPGDSPVILQQFLLEQYVRLR